MTQPQRNEDRLLDYLYGELDADARAQVESELANSPSLRDELEGHRRVRRAFAELPKTEQSAESTQRMTALLMQQAAQQVAGHKQAETQTGGGGKLLAFQPRTLRRLLTNPATGIFAAAAAALFWVVFKTQAPPSTHQTEPTEAKPAVVAAKPPEPAAEVPAPSAVAAEGIAAAPQSAKKASGSTKADEQQRAMWAQLSRDAASDTLSRGPEPSPRAGSTPEGKPAATSLGRSKSKGSLDGKVVALNDLTPPPGRPYGAKTERAEAPYRAADEAKKDSAPAPQPASMESNATPSQAAAPSNADGEGSVRAGIAQTQARRNQRVIEELANQELGAMPGVAGQTARPAAAAPAVPQGAERYAQAEPGDKAAAEEDARNGPPTNNLRSREAGAGAGASPGTIQAAPPPPALQASAANNIERERSNLPLLAAVQDLLKQGRCSEANAALVRVEQSFPATRGLSEARAQWQRSCGANTGAERQMLAQPTDSQQAVPLPSPAPISRDAQRSKRAIPARAKSSAPSKANADSASAY